MIEVTERQKAGADHITVQKTNRNINIKHIFPAIRFDFLALTAEGRAYPRWPLRQMEDQCD